uniref:Uncharacterized protein n=1 Tax=Knipowitschia caucasica TaxID=637954 RepID=A0AAV2K7A9_KNICA
MLPGLRRKRTHRNYITQAQGVNVRGSDQSSHGRRDSEEAKATNVRDVPGREGTSNEPPRNGQHLIRQGPLGLPSRPHRAATPEEEAKKDERGHAEGRHNGDIMRGGRHKETKGEEIEGSGQSPITSEGVDEMPRATHDGRHHATGTRHERAAGRVKPWVPRPSKDRTQTSPKPGKLGSPARATQGATTMIKRRNRPRTTDPATRVRNPTPL